MDWLHFVGQGYYTADAFKQEAERLGVSRRIALRLLGGFNWGDRIWLAQGKMRSRRDGTPGGATVFASFKFETLGVSGAPVRDLDLDPETIDEPFTPVERGCGTYILNRIYRIGITIPDLATKLRTKHPKAEVFLQGRIDSLHRPVKLSSYSFRWGFQRLDEVLVDQVLDAAIDVFSEGGLPEIPGLYPNAWSAEDILGDNGEYAVLSDYEVKA